MKKTIGFICALIAFLTSCTNDDVIRQSENNQSVTISAAVDISFEGEKQALSSKSRAGSSYRYIMEVYSDENYTTMVGKQETSEDGNFTLTLDRTKKYYVLLWADANGGSVYETKSLKSVTLNKGVEVVEAFSGKSTIEGGNSKISVTLKRCVGELRLMETGTIPAGSITVKFIEPKSFDVSTGCIGTETQSRTQKITFTESGTTSSPVQLNSNSIYILSNVVSSDIDFTIQYKAGSEGTPEDEIIVAGSIKANRRTNIKGHYTSAIAFTIADYYQWDAYSHYVSGTNSLSNTNWIPGSEQYHWGTSVTAEQSCKDCPTASQIMDYIKADHFWDDGHVGKGRMTYTVDKDGTTEEYHTGMWFKKGVANDKSTTEIDAYNYVPQNWISDDIRTSGEYFFLPSAGYCMDCSFDGQRSSGAYWSSTPGTLDWSSYYLYFNQSGASLFDGERSYGLLPWIAE